MAEPEFATGGCLCGAVRFRVALPSKWVAHCHCGQCRRAHGAAFVTWAGFYAAGFALLPGSAPLRRYASPEHGVRSSCGTCGSPLAFEDERWAGEIHLAVGAFDAPLDRPPKGHAYFDDRAGFVTIGDELPRFGGTDGVTPWSPPPVRLRPLDPGAPADRAALARVLAAAPGYHLAVAGRLPGPAEADELLAACPPGVEPGAKQVFLVETEAGPIGVIDYVRGFPRPAVGMLGLLLLAEPWQGRGLGKAAYRELEARVRAGAGITRMRLGVVRTNPRALPFWQGLGFVATGEVKPHQAGTVASEVLVLEKALRG